MIVILSPSKTMDMKKSEFLEEKSPMDLKKTMYLRNKLKNWSKKKIKKVMKLSDKQTEDVHQMYQDYDALEEGHAIMSYTGFVFKKLQIVSYQASEFSYLEQHVRILDALYGVLHPSTIIKPYRLDFLMKFNKNLYQYWTITDLFKNQVILNLASSEYSQMVKDLDMIDVSFLQKKNDQYKNIATYTKQARGMLLNYMVLNKVDDLEKLKDFQEDGYLFNKDLSSATELVFTR